MSTIPDADLLTLLDSLASAKLIFDAALGTVGTETDTVSKAAANDVATLTAVADNDVQSDLAAVLRSRALGTLAGSLYGTLGAYNVWWALDKHLGGLDSYMRTNNLRASTHVKALGFPLSAEQVLPPVVDPMATFTATAAGAGTFTSVADIDTSLYGRAWLQVVATSTIGPSPLTATIYGLQVDGQTPTSVAVVIAANSSVGTTVNVGVLGTQSDSYDSLTDITIAGGTAGDTFKVRSRAERTITATS